MQQLKDAPVPHVRQVGPLAPAPQLLSAKRLANNTRQQSSPNIGGGERSATKNICPPGSPHPPSSRRAASATAGATCSLLPSCASLSILQEAERCESAPHLRDAPPRKRPGGQSGGLGSLPKFQPVQCGSPSHTDACSSPKVGLARAYSCGATLDSPCGAAETVAGASCADALSQTRSPARKHARASESDEYAEVERFHRATTDMFRGSADRKDACWLASHTKTPLQMGEEMLLEQVALQDRRHLMRTVCRRSEDDSMFRHHVAQNVRSRLQEEAKREAGRGPSLSVDQQCINIKKQLDLMVKARGELKGLRAKVQMVCEDDDNELMDLYRGFRGLTGNPRASAAVVVDPAQLHRPAADESVVPKTKIIESCETAKKWADVTYADNFVKYASVRKRR